MNPQTTPDPVTNEERVMVRQTATGFEQGIAGLAGFLTAGPLGAAASWATIRGLQGKWAPWTILGFIGAPVCLFIQVFTIGMLTQATNPPSKPPVSKPVTTSSLPAYNIAIDGGTTLVTKCQNLKAAQERNDYAQIASISFSIGSDHDTPLWTSPDEDCDSVGVDVS